jgi:phosphoadenosine phosphosulfate reductase
VSIKNISRYQNFGFRQEWLELYFELLDEFWANERMGKYMIVGFKTWLKEAGITENNALTQLGKKLQALGSDSPITWGIIYVNLCYDSPIVNWYARKIEIGRTYFSDDLPIILGEEYSSTVKKNALSSLKETLRLSPIGWLLLQGECEMKGKSVTAITKGSWYDAEPLVILYTLYRFAEKMEGLYSFTLTDLLDDSDERLALSPRAIFGIERNVLKPILQGLANNYSEYIQVDFNKGIMENIDLPAGKNGKNALDVLSLI